MPLKSIVNRDDSGEISKPKTKKKSKVKKDKSYEIAVKLFGFCEKHYPDSVNSNSAKLINRKKPDPVLWSNQLRKYQESSSYSLDQFDIALDYYIKRYKDFWPIVSILQFCKHIDVIYKASQSAINPCTLDEIQPIMEELSTFLWDCSQEAVEIAVGQSLFNMRLYIGAIRNLLQYTKDNVYAYLNSEFGDINEYIEFHFTRWCLHSQNTRHIERIVLTKDNIRSKIKNLLYKYGLSNSVNEYIEIIESSVQ
jgi:hypothetical protein